MKTGTRNVRMRFSVRDVKSIIIAFCVTAAFCAALFLMVTLVKPTQTCLEWSRDYDHDPEVCWGYGENEREFAPADEELTRSEYEEIVTRFYENR
jgi:hypothetical protein